MPDGPKSENLTARRELDHETIWRATRDLVDSLFGVLEDDAVMERALDIVMSLLGADRGLLILVSADGSTQTLIGRGHQKPLTVEEREEISKTIVREALETGRGVVWDLFAQPPESESFLELGIFAALAAPLHRSRVEEGGLRGALYLDFRDRKKFVGERHIEFFMSAATLMGAVLDQGQRSRMIREHLREARSHVTVAQSPASLDDLLAPASMQTIRAEVLSLLGGSSSVLILGESGTGKTLLARAIAERTGRRPIVRALLGSSDDLNTITSELFGHEKGSFSGATSKRVGLVEFAHRGIIILDELLNLPLTAQKLLLDFTQFGWYRPLGQTSAEPKRADVRIFAATNGDLPAAIREGRFREDLFQRLAGVTLELPPLRERREDILPLAEAALRRADPSRTYSISVALRRLLLSPAIEWAGNVRQLERVITRARERAVSRDPEATVLTPEHVEPRDVDRSTLERDSGPPKLPATMWQELQAERARIDEREQAVIRGALQQCGGVVAHAARELGIARTTLSSRIDALAIRAPKR